MEAVITHNRVHTSVALAGFAGKDSPSSHFKHGLHEHTDAAYVVLHHTPSPAPLIPLTSPSFPSHGSRLGIVGKVSPFSTAVLPRPPMRSLQGGKTQATSVLEPVQEPLCRFSGLVEDASSSAECGAGRQRHWCRGGARCVYRCGLCVHCTGCRELT